MWYKKEPLINYSKIIKQLIFTNYPHFIHKEQQLPQIIFAQYILKKYQKNVIMATQYRNSRYKIVVPTETHYLTNTINKPLWAQLPFKMFVTRKKKRNRRILKSTRNIWVVIILSLNTHNSLTKRVETRSFTFFFVNLIYI